MVTSIVLFAAIFLNEKAGHYMTISGYVLLFGTMARALVSEYFIRETPVPFLVSIAITLALIAVSQLIVKFI